MLLTVLCGIHVVKKSYSILLTSSDISSQIINICVPLCQRCIVIFLFLMLLQQYFFITYYFCTYFSDTHTDVMSGELCMQFYFYLQGAFSMAYPSKTSSNGGVLGMKTCYFLSNLSNNFFQFFTFCKT